jgi:hypothetical protein
VEVDGSTHWDDAARAKDAARDRWLEGQGVEVLRIPASRIYHDFGAVVDGVLRQAEALIAQRLGLAPSTTRSSPAFRRGRRAVPLPPLRGGGKGPLLTVHRHFAGPVSGRLRKVRFMALSQ